MSVVVTTIESLTLTSMEVRTVPAAAASAAPDRLPPWDLDDPPDDSLEDLLARCPDLADEAWLADGDPDWADPPPGLREVLKAGFWDRTCGDGAGFAAGGVCDRVPPGPVLAGFARDAWADGLGRLSD